MKKGQIGSTCDISAWDAVYLAVFWMLNTIGWVTFYWHWKHITLWQGNVSQFNESSTYLMGWLRDYLWLNSSQNRLLIGILEVILEQEGELKPDDVPRGYSILEWIDN